LATVTLQSAEASPAAVTGGDKAVPAKEHETDPSVPGFTTTRWADHDLPTCTSSDHGSDTVSLVMPSGV
jgi:hypothetical protein